MSHGPKRPAHDLRAGTLPLLSLAIIAFSEYRKKDKTAAAKGFSFGDRGMRAWISAGVGHCVLALGGGWMAALAASLGGRILLARSGARRALLKRLKRCVHNNEKHIATLKRKMESAGRYALDESS